MFMRLCSIEDIPSGEMRQFDMMDEEILVLNLEDKFYCLAARCSHAGAPLAEGKLDGDMVVCPWHHSRFRLADGSVVDGPARDPLRVFPILVKEGQIMVDLNEEDD